MCPHSSGLASGVSAALDSGSDIELNNRTQICDWSETWCLKEMFSPLQMAGTRSALVETMSFGHYRDIGIKVGSKLTIIIHWCNPYIFVLGDHYVVGLINQSYVGDGVWATNSTLVNFVAGEGNG